MSKKSLDESTTNSVKDFRSLFLSYCPPPLDIAKGTLLLKQGQSSQWMYFVLSGNIKTYTTNYYGHDLILDYLTENSLLGLTNLDDNSISVLSAECVTPVSAIACSHDIFQKMLKENENFCNHIFTICRKLIRRSIVEKENLSIKTVETRLANYLYLYLLDTGKITIEQNVPVEHSQKIIAERINASRVQVSRIFSEYKKEGIVQTKDKGFIITDINKLIEKSHLAI